MAGRARRSFVYLQAVSLSADRVVACFAVVGDERYRRAAAGAVASVLSLTDFDLVIATDDLSDQWWPSDPRVTVVGLEQCLSADRAERFLIKFDALEATLHRSEANYIVMLDVDTKIVAPIGSSEVVALLAGKDFAMVEQTGIRGSDMGREEFLEHYRDHSLKFIEPAAQAPALSDFRYFNSGVVFARSEPLSELISFVRQRPAVADRPHEVDNQMIADQDYFQYWVNTARPGSCAELGAGWNHCYWWDDPWPIESARILHFSNFCNGPTEESIAPGFEAVIVSFESAAVLERSVRSARVAGAARVTVVDNASGDGSADLARRLGCTVIQMETNQGFAKAANAGAFAAEADLLCFLNPDCIVDRPTADAAAAMVNADPFCCVVPDFKQIDGSVQAGVRGGYTRRRLLGDLADARWRGNRSTALVARLPGFDSKSWQWPIGACIFAARDQFLEVGGFDESYFVYMEDVAFGHRWCRAGGRIRSSGTTVEHLSRRGSAVSRPHREELLRAARVRYAAQEFGPLSGALARFVGASAR